MPNTIPTPCPDCQHPASSIVVRSTTVMTLSCPQCGHIWAIDLTSVPPQVRVQWAAVLRDTA